MISFMPKTNNCLIVIVGPTAVGKTDLCIKLAKHLNTEIISCDSRQIYKELRIGTASPTPQQLGQVKHYGIATHSIQDYYNASMFEFDTLKLLSELFKKHQNVIMTGGSGLYVDAVCWGIDDLPTIDPEVRAYWLSRLNAEGIESLRFELQHLDPEYYKKVDLKNHKRILKALEVCIMTGKPYSHFLTQSQKKRPFNIIKAGLTRPREELYQRINKRVDIMIEQGLVEEARQLYPHRKLNALNTVGYKQLFPYFENHYTLEQAIDLIKRDSRRYAKRQLSWFRRDPEMQWFKPENYNELVDYILNNIP